MKDMHYGNMIFQDDKHFQWTGRHLVHRADEPDDFGGVNFGDYTITGDAGDDSDQVSIETEEEKPKTPQDKFEAVSALKDELGTQKESLEEDRQKVVSYGNVFRNADVGFKKMLKNKKTTDKFKAKKGNLEKRLAKAKDRLDSLKLEEIKPKTADEEILEFFKGTVLPDTGNMAVKSVESNIARLENQLSSYNSFEEFLNTYGDAESEHKRIKKEISSYYK